MAKRKLSGNSSATSNPSNGDDSGGKNNDQRLSKSKKRHLRKMQKAAAVANSSVGDKKKTPTKDSIANPINNKTKPAPTKKAKVMQEENPSSEKNEVKSTSNNSISSKKNLDLGSKSIRPKSALQQAFLSRLAGSRFRELNEDLYTTNSTSAFERFQSNPELFDQYHEGFREQVKSWPVNPVDAIFRWILSVNRKRESEEGKELKPLSIADFGCGDAKLADKLLKMKDNGSGKKKKKKNKDAPSKCPFKVHSFDLVANGNPHITPCDMANVPLKKGTMDIAVFVLALMGTNIADFIREAHRVLTPDGILKIAEVRSRFESSTAQQDEEETNQKGARNGGGKKKYKYSKKQSDDSVLNEFVNVMKNLGFGVKENDRSNKMFILLEFEKTGKVPSRKATFTAKPCIYKRR